MIAAPSRRWPVRRCVALVLALAGAMGRAWAQGLAPAASAPAAPTFRLLALEATPGSERLIDGVPVRVADWPALVSAEVGTQRIANVIVPIRCSGVLVGPGSLLTAAHCLDPGDTSGLRTSARLGLTAKVSVDLRCTPSPQYAAADNFSDSPRVPQDYALCRFEVPSGVTLPAAERLDIEAPLAPHDAVLMSGWGCRELPSAGALSSGPVPAPALTVADARIDAVARPGGEFEDGFASIVSNLGAARSHSALCPGDSGGALFSGATVRRQASTRRVRAVNSWVGADGHSNTMIRSRVAPLATDDFRRFAEQWLADNPLARLCGVRSYTDARNCRL